MTVLYIASSVLVVVILLAGVIDLFSGGRLRRRRITIEDQKPK